MKRLKLSVFMSIGAMSFMHVSTTKAQNLWPNSGGIDVQTTTAGNVGIGLLSPSSMLHLHGLNNYTSPPGKDGMPGMLFGPSARIQFTNSTIPSTLHRGFEIRQSGFHMYFNNFENRGNIQISAVETPTLLFHSESKRIFSGYFGSSGLMSTPALASFNILRSNDNALYVRAQRAEHYGLRIESRNNQRAFEILNNEEGMKRNFLVTGEGFVFARRYTTTLGPIADYVFEPTYKLMPLSDLRTYLNTNKHLPNVPSTHQTETEETDLGEFVKVLLEKVEESVLYILQLEERIRTLESGN